MPTFGSLFSGIGGLDLGLERAGWTCAWQVELDEWCRAVLARHWPNVPRFGDIRSLRSNAHRDGLEGVEPSGAAPRPVERVDLVCGGFPCQPVSRVGHRRGQEDERWLWPEFARVLGVLRPPLVFVENVTGLYKRGMGDVLGDLAELGYDAGWDCIPAAAVGAPHLRERVWIVAYRPSNASRPNTHSVGSHRTPANQAGSGGEVQPGDEQGGVFGSLGPPPSNGHWQAEPDVERLVDGFPDLVAQTRAVGNAVVPQVAEWIGRRMLLNAEDQA